MPIAVCCPACQKRFAAPDAFAGKRAKCSGCGTVLIVPAPAAPNAPPQGAALTGTAPAAPVKVVPVKVVPAGAAPVQGRSGPVQVPTAKVVPVKTVPAQPVVTARPVAQSAAPAAAPAKVVAAKVVAAKVVSPSAGPAKVVAAKVVPARVVGGAVPQASAHAAPVARAGSGNSLLDALEQAESSHGLGPDPFGASGDVFGGPAAGRAVLSPAYPRKSFPWVGVLIGLAVVLFVGLVGVGVTVAIRMIPADEEPGPETRFASATPRPTYHLDARPAAARAAGAVPVQAESAEQSETERELHAMMALARDGR